MEVVSVNVGLPQELEWRGRSFRTAIVKTPVEGRRRVGRLNVDGDAQTDLKHHGGPDSIEIVARAPDGPTVTEMFRDHERGKTTS